MWQYHYSNPNEYIEHHGILGMKWGVRRYQNEDGSLTKAGRRRYGSENEKSYERRLNDLDEEISLHEARYNTAHKKDVKYTLKAKNYIDNGGRNEKKMYKLKEKSDKNRKIADEAKSKQDKYTSETWKTISKAIEKNYNVNGMRTTRLVDVSSINLNKGRVKVSSVIRDISSLTAAYTLNSLLGGGIGGKVGIAGTYAFLNSRGTQAIDARKYKVTKNKYYSHMNGKPRGNLYLEK